MQNLHQMIFTNELGGGEIVALQLAADLQKKSGHCKLWIPGPGRSMAAAERTGLMWQEFQLGDVLTHSKIDAARSNWKIWRLLHARSPGLLHVHSPCHYGALSFGLQMSGLKRIVHVHLEIEKEVLKWAFRRPPEVIMTCARYLVDYVRSILPEGKQETQQIVAVPNAIDTSRFSPGDKQAARARLGVPIDKFLVLMVANLAVHKGQETALRTIAILNTMKVPVVLWMAGIERGGGAEFTTRLKCLARDLQVQDQIIFLGQREDIPQLLRAADCLVLPSTLEGLPLSVLEAQACKTLVLASPSAGIPEIVIDGKTGFLIPANDAEGYAARIYAMHQDPLPYNSIAEEAYGIVIRRHAWKEYVERIWEVYQSLLYPPSKYFPELTTLVSVGLGFWGFV